MRSFRDFVPVSVCGLLFALTAVGGFGSPAEGLPVPTVPTTLPQVTTPPVTLPPVTVAPVTLPPVTLAPVTLPPVTVAPVTLPPVTVAPVTLPSLTPTPTTAPARTPAPAPAPVPGATSPPVPGAATAPSATVAGALPAASSPAGAPVAGAVPSVTSPTSAAVVPSLGGTTVTVPTRIPYAPVGPIFGTVGATAEAALGDTPSGAPGAAVAESGAPSAQSSSESVEGAQPTARRGDPTATPRTGGEAAAGSDGGVPERASFVSGSRWCDDADALAPWLADVLCPKVASSPAARDGGGLLDGVFPFVGGTVGTLIVIALVALAGGFALKRLATVGRRRRGAAPS